MQIGSLQVNNPIALGPMAGVTDWAFRTICAELGANITVTEMVSSRALVYKDKKSAALLRKNEGSLCGAQIFGNNPEIMAEGARLALEISGCDFIDINMGCPMPKIANSGDGCGLMRTPELAGEIVKAVVNAVDVPVTVKCRLGWDKVNINVLDFTKRMEDNGAAMLTVHGRTRSMLYSGVADWDTITKVKQQLSVPVIANGDIVDGETAVKCLKRTKADGIMIGRATFGNPWVFADTVAALSGDMHLSVRLLPNASIQQYGSLNLHWKIRVSISPAWKHGNILPGTSVALPTHPIIKNRFPPFKKWTTFTASPTASARICNNCKE